MNFAMLSEAINNINPNEVERLLFSMQSGKELLAAPDKCAKVMTQALQQYADLLLEKEFFDRQQPAAISEEKEEEYSAPEINADIAAQCNDAADCVRILRAYGINRPPEDKFNHYNYAKTSKFYTIEGCCSLSNSIVNDVLNKPTAFSLVLHRQSDVLAIDHYLELLSVHKEFNALMINHRDYIAAYKKHLSQMQQAVNTQQALVLLLNMIGDQSRLKAEQGSDMSRVILFPSLAECACTGFDRTKDIGRATIEAQVLDYANTIRREKHIPLVYLSLGAGELLQDFFQCAGLLHQGHSLEVHLVEPSRIDESALRQFNFLKNVAIECGRKFSVVTYKNIYQFVDKNHAKEIDLALAVDFENIFKGEVFRDVMQVQLCLADNGRFFFSFDEYRLQFSKDELCFAEIRADKRADEALVAPLAKQMMAGKPANLQVLRYASLSRELQFDEWIKILPSLSALPCEKVVISLLPVKKKNYFDGFTDKNNTHFNEASMQQFFFLMPARKGSGSKIF